MVAWLLMFHCGPAIAESQAAPAPAGASRVNLAEAVLATLRRDPNIRIQEEQIKFSQGALQREEGAFDYALDTAISQGLTRSPRSESERLSFLGQTNILHNASDLSNHRAAVTKLFRSGTSVSAGVELNRLHHNLEASVVNRANVNLIVTVPLLKRFGASSTAAAERSARVVAEAAFLEMRFVAGQRVLNTAAAYWECLAAERHLEVFRDSAKRSKELLEGVVQLVNAGEIPRAELRQTEADVAQKIADLKAGEQRFTQARQNFGLALGLADEELDKIPLPLQSWPAVQTNQVPRFTGQAMIEQSLIRRPDYLAARKTGLAAEILEKGARRDLRPQLDLTLEAGYSGLSEGAGLERFYASVDPRPIRGPNALATLRLLVPFENRAAKGLLAQREALTKQASLREQNLARAIGSAIRVVLSDLDQSAQEAVRAREAAALYRQTVENEREKLRIGTSTIVNVITLADRLDLAEIRMTDALMRYATALARIRYETGLLPTAKGQDAVVSMDDLTTLPTQSDLESGEPGASPQTLKP